MALPEVEIEVFESGQGPRHTFAAKLQGWDADRLDLETIQNTYNLNALYAFSRSGGRGQRLLFHPRSGLSFVCYSAKPGAVIRLDSDPKTPVKKVVLRVTVVILVVGLLLLTTLDDAGSQWYHKLKYFGSSGVGWLIALVILCATQATGWSRNLRNSYRRSA